MKKFIKNVLWLAFISFSIGYFYINRDRVIQMATTFGIYAKSVVITEQEYTEDFKINDVKLNINSYYYNKLDDNQKTIYKSLANGIKELNNEIILKDYDSKDNEKALKDIDIVFNYFCLDHPEVFYLDNNYTISNMSSIIGNKVVIEVSYSVENVDKLNEKVNAINEKIEEYLKDIKKEELIEMEIRLHDRLARRVKYCEYDKIEDIPNSCHTIEGAFLNDVAVCDGLSKAIQILLSNVNIENIVVLGELKGGPHAWNMVKLENSWYNLDLTSNKSIKVDGIVVHSYFNVSDEYISKTHTFSEKENIPKSDDENNKYNYYVYNNKFIEKNDNFRSKLREIIINNDNSYLLEFSTNSTENVPSITYNTILAIDSKEYLNNYQFKYYNILNTYIVIKNNI